MKGFKINEEPKLEKEHCESCKDGELWENKKRSESGGPYTPRNDEFICGVCLTKYIFERR